MLTYYLSAIIFSAVVWNVLFVTSHAARKDAKPTDFETMVFDKNEDGELTGKELDEWKESGSKVTLLGASGGVMAVIIAFCLRFPLAPIIRFPFTIPAWMVGLFYVVGDLSGYMSPDIGSGPRTAYEAHLAGAFFAAATWYFQIQISAIFDNSWLVSLRQRFRRMLTW